MAAIKKNVYWKWGLTAFLTVCAILIFYDTFYQGGTLQLFLTKLSSVLAPVLYGFALAYLLTPVVKWFERGILWCANKCAAKREKPVLPFAAAKKPMNKEVWLRAAAILLTWVLTLAAVYLLMSVLVPQLVESFTMLIKNMRSYYDQVYYWVDTWLTANPEIGSWANEVLSGYYQDALSFLTNKVLPWAQQLAGNLTGGIWTGIWNMISFAKNLIIGIIISVYLLAMKEKGLVRACKAIYAIFHEATADLIMRGSRHVNAIFSGFIRGKLLDSLIIGLLCFIGCSLLKIPYTPLISVVVGITNVIPFFGPFLGAIPSAFLILLASPIKCLYFIIFVFLLQQLDGNVIGPKILGESTGISSFWVIVAILVGGGFGGILGMFIGVPVFACLQMLCKWLIDRRLTKRGMPTEAYAYAHRGGKPPEDTPPVEKSPDVSESGEAGKK